MASIIACHVASVRLAVLWKPVRDFLAPARITEGDGSLIVASAASTALFKRSLVKGSSVSHSSVPLAVRAKARAARSTDDIFMRADRPSGCL